MPCLGPMYTKYVQGKQNEGCKLAAVYVGHECNEGMFQSYASVMRDGGFFATRAKNVDFGRLSGGGVDGAIDYIPRIAMFDGAAKAIDLEWTIADRTDFIERLPAFELRPGAAAIQRWEKWQAHPEPSVGWTSYEEDILHAVEALRRDPQAFADTLVTEHKNDKRVLHQPSWRMQGLDSEPWSATTARQKLGTLSAAVNEARDALYAAEPIRDGYTVCGADYEGMLVEPGLGVSSLERGFQIHSALVSDPSLLSQPLPCSMASAAAAENDLIKRIAVHGGRVGNFAKELTRKNAKKGLRVTTVRGQHSGTLSTDSDQFGNITVDFDRTEERPEPEPTHISHVTIELSEATPGAGVVECVVLGQFDGVSIVEQMVLYSPSARRALLDPAMCKIGFVVVMDPTAHVHVAVVQLAKGFENLTHAKGCIVQEKTAWTFPVAATDRPVLADYVV